MHSGNEGRGHRSLDYGVRRYYGHIYERRGLLFQRAGWLFHIAVPFCGEAGDPGGAWRRSAGASASSVARHARGQRRAPAPSGRDSDGVDTLCYTLFWHYERRTIFGDICGPIATLSLHPRTHLRHDDARAWGPLLFNTCFATIVLQTELLVPGFFCILQAMPYYAALAGHRL